MFIVLRRVAFVVVYLLFVYLFIRLSSHCELRDIYVLFVQFRVILNMSLLAHVLFILNID
jgi:hypothetical protein